MIVLIKGIICPCPSPHTRLKSLKFHNMIRVESDLLEAYIVTDQSYGVTKILFHAL